MIKKLVFIGALLVPGLVYGANPTANLSVQIVPGGSTPAVPPGAQAAGFTTLAANYDFTQPMPANWLGCQPWDGQKHQWYQDSGGGAVDTSGKIPCPLITTDPLTGGTVLDIPWKPSYGPSANYPFNMNQITTASPDSGAYPNNAFPATFPTNYYIEYVFRVQPTPNVISPGFQTQGNYHAAWELFDGGGAQFNAYESDTMEMFQIWGLTPGTTIHDWGGTDAGNQYFLASAGYDPRSYHTWATRRTSDGVSNTGFCIYLDGPSRACSTYTHPGGADLTKRVKAILWNGMVCGSDFSDRSCWPNFTSVDMYVKSVRVWSCANWQTTMCNRTVLTGAP